jgi:hypothetical protein
MDRVQASEAWGRGFESHAAHQILMIHAYMASLILTCKQFANISKRLLCV